MTTSLESQLAAAIKRVDELERALVTFDALEQSRDLAMRLVVAESSLKEAWATSERYRHAAESLANQVDSAYRRSRDLEDTISKIQQDHQKQMESILKNINEAKLRNPYLRPLILSDGRRVPHGLIYDGDQYG